MKRTNSKIFAIIIAVVMMLLTGMSISHASITSDTNKGKIKVSDLEAGATVKIYQLTTVNYDYTADSPKETPYTWVPAVKTWIDANYPQYSDPEKFDAENISSEISTTFYDKLTTTLNGTTAKATKTAEGTASYPVVTDKSVEFTDCEMGTYLVVIENGYRVYRPSVVNLTPKFNTDNKQWELADAVVEIKSTTPQIKKTVTNDTKVEDNYGTDEEIDFTIVADVPTYPANSISKKYAISDTLGGGLILNGTISVSGISSSGTSTPLTTGYTKDEPTDKKSFSLDFTYDNISSYKQIKVTYKAKLDKTATTVLGKDANTNDAVLTYSNNPYVADNTQIQESSNKVFTYGIEITKEDKADATKKLEEAQFTLSKGGTELKFTKVGDVYYASADGTDVLTTGADGLLKIYGLDEGTYSLKETKAPEGYNIAKDAIEIEIKDADADGKIDGLLKDEAESEDKTGIIELTVKNSKGFQLPVTGGIGTTLFVAGGVVFVGIGIGLFVVAIKRRKK